MMKMTPFLILSLFCASSGAVLAQEMDIPLFAADSQTPGFASGSDAQIPQKVSSLPNVGQNANRVDSLKIAPPPFPPIEVPVQMEKTEGLPSTPFTQRMVTHKSGTALPQTSPSTASQSSQLSRPVDWNAVQNKSIEESITKGVQPQEEPNLDKKAETTVPEAPQKDAAKPEPAQPVIQPMFTAPSFQAQMTTDNVLMKPQYNAYDFNIAGLKLGMEPQETIDMAQEAGFTLANMSYAIPAFMTANFENDCRAQGLYQVRLIHECVRDMAKAEDVYYISELTFEKKESKEQITVLFTSGLTGNKAFKVDYIGFGDNSLGTSYKDLIKKTNRRDIFWKLVFEKYGKPNYDKMLLWGDPRKAYMKAYLERNELNARIVLEDKEIPLEDMNMAYDIEEKREKPHHFSF